MLELIEIVIGCITALLAIWVAAELVARLNKHTLFLPKSTRRVKAAREDAEVAKHHEDATRHEVAIDFMHARRDKLLDAIKEGDVSEEERILKELMPP